MDRTRFIVAVVLLLLIFILALPTVANLLHLAPWSPSEVSNLSAVVATTFTAGGLIVALVSIFTLFNANKIVAEAVSEAVKSVSERFETRIQSHIQAYSLLSTAKDWWERSGYEGLPYVEYLVERAEAAEPTLRETKAWSGQIFLMTARASYLNEKLFYFGEQSPPPPADQIPPFVAQAIPRLDFAIEKPDDESMRTRYGLFMVQGHALLNDRPSRISQLLRAIRTDDGLPPLDGITALTLLASCRTESQVQDVLAAYGNPAITPNQLKDSLTSLPPGVMEQSFVAFPRNAQQLQDVAPGPLVVTFRSVDTWKTGFLEWKTSTQPMFAIRRGGIPDFPRFDEKTGSQANPPFTLLNDLLSEVFAKLVFVVPLDPQAPWFD